MRSLVTATLVVAALVGSVSVVRASVPEMKIAVQTWHTPNAVSSVVAKGNQPEMTIDVREFSKEVEAAAPLFHVQYKNEKVGPKNDSYGKLFLKGCITEGAGKAGEFFGKVCGQGLGQQFGLGDSLEGAGGAFGKEIGKGFGRLLGTFLDD